MKSSVLSASAFPSLCKPYASFSLSFPKSTTHIQRKKSSQNAALRCKCSILPGGPASGDSDSSNKSILDAFFLGKAVAEALNERIESTVGEILSTIGRLQAEQQKQVQDFQEDVLERAKKSKEKAARETVEAQGLVSKSAVETKVTDSATYKTSNSAVTQVTSVESTDASETDSEPAKEDKPTTSSTSDE